MRLYELIWKRMTASQMADAVLDSTSVEIAASAESGRAYVFRASGSVLRFAGFRVLYMEDRDDAAEGRRPVQVAQPQPGAMRWSAWP